MLGSSEGAGVVGLDDGDTFGCPQGVRNGQNIISTEQASTYKMALPKGFGKSDPQW